MLNNTISYSNAVFYEENKSEIDEILNKFKRVRAKVLSNTLIQVTRWDLIQKFYDVSPFVDDCDVTENSLRLIKQCIDEAEDFIASDRYSRLESTCKALSAVKSVCRAVSDVKSACRTLSAVKSKRQELRKE